MEYKNDLNLCKNSLDPESTSKSLELQQHHNNLLVHEEQFSKQCAKAY